MRLRDCNPEITESGALAFRMPGFLKIRCGITRWNEGFDTFCHRNGRREPAYFWSLELLSDTGAGVLPAEVEAFVGEIPASVRERVARFEFAQCLTLRLIARSPAARELQAGNPLLFWLLLVAVFDARVDPGLIESYCSRKQADILARIIPGKSRARLKLVKKTEWKSGSLGEARALIDAYCREQLIEAAAHAASVDTDLLTVLVRCPSLASRSMLALVQRHVREAGEDFLRAGRELEGLVSDIERVGRMLRIDRPRQAIERCADAAALWALHDRWVERMNEAFERPRRPAADVCGRRNPGADAPSGSGIRRRLIDVVNSTPVDVFGLKFPPPPLPGTPDIEPITNAVDLLREGRDQENCVGSYGARIAEGDCYIYRVHRPQRATLELCSMGEHWTLGQLKLARNASPRKVTVEAVREWFTEHAGHAPSARE